MYSYPWIVRPADNQGAKVSYRLGIRNGHGGYPGLSAGRMAGLRRCVPALCLRPNPKAMDFVFRVE